MKDIVFSLLFLAIFAVFANGNTVFTGETVVVKLNKEATFADAKMTVRFLEVVEDSRCPEGVDCIWAGNAKIRVEISSAGKEPKTLELNTTIAESVVYEGREVKLTGLTPHPKAGSEIDKSDYTATIELGGIKPCQ